MNGCDNYIEKTISRQSGKRFSAALFPSAAIKFKRKYRSCCISVVWYYLVTLS